VEGIFQNDDHRVVERELSILNDYYSKIKHKTDSLSNMENTWRQYEKYVVNHSADLLAMSKMAQGGGDEKNLLDKQQRLTLFNYVIASLRILKAHSKHLYEQLELTSHYSVLQNALNY
jgi:hypothetical protein